MTPNVASVIGQLRRACLSTSRDPRDVQRNAMLWLCVRAGASAERSSFRVPVDRRVIDEARLADTVYLAAIGFLVSARVLALSSAQTPNQVFDDLLRRSPHTVELSGYTDDPLCGVGLFLMAKAVGRVDLSDAVRTSLEEHHAHSAAVGLAIGVAGVAPGREASVANDIGPSWLAAAVLAGRIDLALARCLFPYVEPTSAWNMLLDTVAPGLPHLGADLDSMLVLAALELAPDSTTASNPPGRGVVSEAEHGKKTILFLAANPGSTNRLALDEEAREIEAKIRAAQFRDALRLKTRWAVRPDDLLQALNEDRPSVVHFSGHGTGAPGIVLHDDSGGQRLVPGSALRRLFSALKDDIRVVVLSACHSNEQAREIATAIDCVVCMKQSIGDVAARTFAAAFYRALGFGRSVGNAFEQGLAAIDLHGLLETDVPELLLRPGLDANRMVLIPSGGAP